MVQTSYYLVDIPDIVTESSVGLTTVVKKTTTDEEYFLRKKLV